MIAEPAELLYRTIDTDVKEQISSSSPARKHNSIQVVTPAQAGVQKGTSMLDSRLRGNDVPNTGSSFILFR
jgi:hypothetical protein